MRPDGLGTLPGHLGTGLRVQGSGVRAQLLTVHLADTVVATSPQLLLSVCHQYKACCVPLLCSGRPSRLLPWRSCRALLGGRLLWLPPAAWPAAPSQLPGPDLKPPGPPEPLYITPQQVGTDSLSTQQHPTSNGCCCSCSFSCRCPQGSIEKDLWGPRLADPVIPHIS
jgi:hypothetical protein